MIHIGLFYREIVSKLASTALLQKKNEEFVLCTENESIKGIWHVLQVIVTSNFSFEEQKVFHIAFQ